MLGLCMALGPLGNLQAETVLIPDPSAPPEQQASVINAANGVAVALIQTPGSDGVSRNTYSQFDVDQEGMIFNNGRTASLTQLGGWLDGNPYLAQGSAAVILNEVNADLPSQLQGRMEVGGDRAEVVIANPAGIGCNGCGFINASRGSLISGQAVFGGGNLLHYRVLGGQVWIEGRGHDGSQADYIDIITRSLVLNGAIRAKTLKVVTGANQLSADLSQLSALGTPAGAAQAFAIDVGQLGGMYAGKIFLRANEHGVGVRNAGTLSATDGDLVLHANGQLSNQGLISANRNLAMDIGHGVINSGTLQAQDGLQLKTGGVLENHAGGETLAKTTQIQAASVTNRGLIDGQYTRLDAKRVDNLGSGRIYGDKLAASVQQLRNDSENGEAAVMVARSRMDLGIGTLINRDHGLIYSDGDMHIGNALDEHGHAQGEADSVALNSATLEAKGSLNMKTRRLSLHNDNFQTEMRPDPGAGKYIVEYQGAGSDQRYLWGAPGTEIFNDESDQLRTPEGKYESWTLFEYQRQVQTEVVTASDPARITVGEDFNLRAREVVNDKSRVLAGGAINADVDQLRQIGAYGKQTASDLGTATSHWRHHKTGHDDTGRRVTDYQPAPVITEIPLQQPQWEAHQRAEGSAAPLSALTLERNSLYRAAPDPLASYLVETDARFTQNRQWLSSEALLQQLSYNHDSVKKRLGDGFYEQRLVREQLAQLTGRRFLDGYSDDEAQYRALLNSGASIANAWNLRPGVTLSAEQVAKLQQDIVWLEESSVTLPNGQVQRALVPRVYIAANRSQLKENGALISGAQVNLNLSGDLHNSGAVQSSSTLSINAENVHNQGGRISGDQVRIDARRDLTHVGGEIEGERSVKLNAGNNLTVRSGMADSQSDQGRRRTISRSASVSVRQDGGVLSLEAARDMTVDAALIENQGAGGKTRLHAGKDLNLGTLTESRQQSLRWDQHNWRNEGERREQGSRILTQGVIDISAGNDINMRATEVTSQSGAIQVQAARDLNVSAGEQQINVDEAHRMEGRSGGFSRKTINTRDTLEKTRAVSGTLSGERITLVAGRDQRVQGATAVASRDLVMDAGRDLSVGAAKEQTHTRKWREEITRGLFKSGTPSRPSITLGKQTEGSEQQQGELTHKRSTLGSLAGSVQMNAGRDNKLAGVELQAAKNIDISGRNVTVSAVVDTLDSRTRNYSETSGLRVGAQSKAVDAVASLKSAVERGAESDDPRLQALHAAKAAYQIKDLSAIAQTVQEKDSKQGLDGKLSIGLGTQRHESQTQAHVDSVQPSTGRAGGNITLIARGDETPEQGDVNLKGSALSGQNVTIEAARDLNSISQAAESLQESQGSKTEVEVGVYAAGSVGMEGAAKGGGGIYGAAGIARSKTRFDSLKHAETQIDARKTFQVSTGRDATFKGAQAHAERMEMNIGRDFHLESEQDREQFSQEGKSAQIEGRYAMVGNDSGVSGQLGYNKTDSDWQSVQEQTGLYAGSGGFDIQVGRHTQLDGAVIASEAAAEKNKLSTDTLGHRSVENHAEFQSVSVNASFSADGQGVRGLPMAAPPINEHSESQTHSAIAPGTLIVRQDAESGQDSSTGLSRDTATAHAPLDKLYDEKKVAQQQELATLLGEVGSRAIGDLAEKQGWKDGSPEKIALHGLLGALAAQSGGGNLLAGLAAGAGSEWLGGKVADYLQTQTHLGESERKAIQQWAALATGALAGGLAGGNSNAALSGGAIALDGERYNRQLHQSEAQTLDALKQGKTEAQRQRLDDAACALVGCADGVPQNDPHYATLLARQQRGMQYREEQQELEASGGFNVSRWEAFNDARSRHDEAVSRIKGGVDLAAGSMTAVASGAMGAGLCTTGALCPVGAGVAVAGTLFGNQQAKEGANALFGPYQSTEGRKVLESFDPKRADGLAPLTQDALNLAQVVVEAGVAKGVVKVLDAGERLGARLQGRIPDQVGVIDEAGNSGQIGSNGLINGQSGNNSVVTNGAANSTAATGSQWNDFLSSKYGAENVTWEWPANRGFVYGADKVDSLQPGQLIDRLGSERGTFASPVGVDAEARALRPGTDLSNLNVYRVVQEVPGTRMGPIAPAFDMPGYGTQYELPDSVANLLKSGQLERVTKP